MAGPGKPEQEQRPGATDGRAGRPACRWAARSSHHHRRHRGAADDDRAGHRRVDVQAYANVPAVSNVTFAVPPPEVIVLVSKPEPVAV